MTRCLLVLVALLFSGCAEITYQNYPGAKSEAEVSIVRLWTPTTTNVFTSPGLLVLKIDGIDAGSNGRTSHAYLTPGEHEFEVKYIQVKAYNLLCGMLCDAIFNKPKIFKATTRAGGVYTLRYVNDKDGTIVLDDRGASYDRRCLRAREFRDVPGGC